MATESIYKETLEALTRLQQFDANTLSREVDLGTQMNFAAAVDPAREIIGVYLRIPSATLKDFTDTQLTTIKTEAQADYNTFDQILKFNATASTASDIRNVLLAGLIPRRDAVFQQLWQYIAYGIARATDTSLLESEARSTIQSIKDQAAKITADLNTAKTDADNVLKEIRAIAFEQGVSQQALYFRQEADGQELLASEWLTRTYKFASAVGIFAVLSLFLHKWDFLKPDGMAESFQLISSKVLIFAVLGYLLLLAARNYATHKHNSVVNRHRQNALLTYRSLVDAAGEKGTEDIVLAHAASCIFAPQETGFSQSKSETSGSKSVLELLTKSTSKQGE